MSAIGVLLAATLQPAAPPPARGMQCSNASSFWTDRGMTQRDFTTIAAVESAADCCALCASNRSCNAWTYHAGQSLCESAPIATMVMGKDKISGSKGRAAAGPPPSRPPAAAGAAAADPAAKAAAGAAAQPRAGPAGRHGYL